MMRTSFSLLVIITLLGLSAPSQVYADCQMILGLNGLPETRLSRVSTAGRLIHTSAMTKKINRMAITTLPDVKIYSVDVDAREIGRANLDGTEYQTLLQAQDIPLSIAIFNDLIYWSTIKEGAADANGDIYRAKRDGSSAELLLSSIASPTDIAFGPDGRLYWISHVWENGSVYSAAADGTDLRLVANLNDLSLRYDEYEGSSAPQRMVIDPLHSKLYIIDGISSSWLYTNSVVWRLNLDGSEGELFASFLGFTHGPTMGAGLVAIALDPRESACYVIDSGKDRSGMYRYPMESEFIPYGTGKGENRDYYRNSYGTTVALLGVEHGLCQTSGTLSGAASADYSVWRPSLGQWYVHSSSPENSTAFYSRQWGLPGDIPLVGNFNGDSVLDMVVWRNDSGTWYICDWDLSGECTSTYSRQFGLPGDVPLIADFDADGLSDLVVWRPSNGTWYYQVAELSPVKTKQWGLPGDTPLSADFNSDGRDDFIVYRPTSGTWFVLYSSVEGDGMTTGPSMTRQWGLPGDYPLIGDYDGDQKPDLAVWREPTGMWYICLSSAEYDCHQRGISKQFGLPGDIPVRGDFDGDGTDDVAVWRESTGTWYYFASASEHVISRQWGLPGDIPVIAITNRSPR